MFGNSNALNKLESMGFESITTEINETEKDEHFFHKFIDRSVCTINFSVK